ncbi:MAG: PEP-CTERM sorting domain-containing protein, partial [Aeoliella sp.]
VVGPRNTSRVDATVTDNGDGTFLYEFEVFNTSDDFFPSGSGASPAGGGGGGGGGGGTPLIVDWELPLFDITDIDESSITSSSNWGFEIVTDHDAIVAPNNEDVWTYNAASDPIAQAGDYGPNPEVFNTPPVIIHWSTDFAGEPVAPIFPGGSRSGFSFLSDYSSLGAPYQASWFFLPQNTGDPPIPDSAFGTPNSPARQAAQGIPEPSTLVMVGFGVLSLLVGMGWVRASDSRLATCVVDTSRD